MTIKVNTDTVIVFDLDDTLYDELSYLISAYKEIARNINELNEKKIFSIMFSMYRNNENVFDYLTDNYRVEKQELINAYRNHFPKIKLKKGAREILETIKKKNGKIGLITDGRSITQRNKIKALKICKYFDFISISEEIKEEKPSSKAFELVQKEIKGKDYYYIGDNLKKDFIAPNFLKWNTIGVIDSGKNIHSNAYLHQIENKLPQFFVYNINEINIK